MQEALAVAKKLYAQLQVPVAEWKFDGTAKNGM
jgi:hypothetical protein